MQKVALQASNLASKVQRFVHLPGKSRSIAAIEPLLQIRIPSAVLDPFPDVPRAARYFIDLKLWLAFFPIEKGGLQCTAQLFVSVNREDPIKLGNRRGVILLFRVARPRPEAEPHATHLCYGFGTIGASGIHYNHFIHNSCQRGEQSWQ